MNLIFGGKDDQGKRYGVYVETTGTGRSRQFRFEAYGRFGDIRGWITREDFSVSSGLETEGEEITHIGKMIQDAKPGLKQTFTILERKNDWI